MATRLLSPDHGCEGVTVQNDGIRRRYSGTTVEVSDSSHVRALRAAGYTVADTGGPPVKRGGFECKPCGFKSFFRLCSRCGKTCERPRSGGLT